MTNRSVALLKETWPNLAIKEKYRRIYLTVHCLGLNAPPLPPKKIKTTELYNLYLYNMDRKDRTVISGRVWGVCVWVGGVLFRSVMDPISELCSNVENTGSTIILLEMIRFVGG